TNAISASAGPAVVTFALSGARTWRSPFASHEQRTDAGARGGVRISRTTTPGSVASEGSPQAAHVKTASTTVAGALMKLSLPANTVAVTHREEDFTARFIADPSRRRLALLHAWIRAFFLGACRAHGDCFTQVYEPSSLSVLDRARGERRDRGQCTL